jgi:D-glucuronyl C5-epimerase-like protein
MTETPLHLMRGNRAMPAALERAINAAFSRGPGYEPTPIGSAFDDRTVKGYYVDFRSKTTSPTARDLNALPAIQLIQLALGWWERHVAGDDGARERFLDLVRVIEGRAVREGEELRWRMNVAVPKYRLTPGWSSALAQSQAASVLVRAHLATGDDRYGDLARRSVEPFLAPEPTDIVSYASSGPVLEEAPSSPPSRILNGWMSALWGLWDVQLALDDSRSRQRFDASLGCLRAFLPSYDTGWWTLYSLYPHPLKDLAKPIYHRFHVTQLEVLHRLTGHDDIAATGARWAGYDRPANRGRAISQKAAFAVAEARRRRRWEREHQTPC